MARARQVGGRVMLRWDDPTLGTIRGAGNERGAGRVGLKRELDPGLGVVRWAYDNSRIDRQWSVREERGFTWWGHRLAQRVRSEPGLDDDGIEVFRVVVRTEVVRDVEDLGRAHEACDRLNTMAATSALVLDPETRTIDSVASAWAHAESAAWVAPMVSAVGALQVAMAEGQADLVATLAGGTVAASAHPTSGERPEPDEMLGVLQLFARLGEGGSAWAGEGMTQALGIVQGLPLVTLATGDEQGMTAEVPYGDESCLIQFTTDERHPALGHGLLVRTSLPLRVADGPAWAASMNRRELGSLVRGHFLGSWVGSARFPTFVAFWPNWLAAAGVIPVNVALSTIQRASWAASLRDAN